MFFFSAADVLNQFRNITRQYSYFFRLFQVKTVAAFDSSLSRAPVDTIDCQ